MRYRLISIYRKHMITTSVKYVYDMYKHIPVAEFLGTRTEGVWFEHDSIENTINWIGKH